MLTPGTWYPYSGTFTEQINSNILPNGSRLETENFSDPIVLLFNVTGSFDSGSGETIEFEWSLDDSASPNIPMSNYRTASVAGASPRGNISQTFILQTAGSGPDIFRLFVRSVNNSTTVTVNSLSVSVTTVVSTIPV